MLSCKMFIFCDFNFLIHFISLIDSTEVIIEAEELIAYNNDTKTENWISTQQSLVINSTEPVLLGNFTGLEGLTGKVVFNL